MKEQALEEKIGKLETMLQSYEAQLMQSEDPSKTFSRESNEGDIQSVENANGVVT
jgi:hypothetical protein